MTLNFEYCECGCKGHEASSKGIHYWLYNSLGKEPKPFYLFRGHGFLGTRLGTFRTFEEAKEFAEKHYDSIP